MSSSLQLSTSSPNEGYLTPLISLSPYTIDVFSRLEDGSYKEYLSTFSSEIPTISLLEPIKILKEDDIIGLNATISTQLYEISNEKFEDKLNRHILDKELKKSIKSFDRIWLLSKKLKAKNDKTINGEYIFMKLQYIQMNIAKISLLIQLQDYHYPRVDKVINEYVDPYNDIPSIKRDILNKMSLIFNEFNDCLLKIQYLCEVMSKLDAEIQTRTSYKINHNYKFRLWCVWNGLL